MVKRDALLAKQGLIGMENSNMIKVKVKLRVALFVFAIMCFALFCFQAQDKLLSHKDGIVVMQELAPQFATDVDWTKIEGKQFYSTVLIENGSISYRLDKVSNWLTHLASLVGYESNTAVAGLSITAIDFDDVDLERISNIPTLKKLSIRHSNISDEGLVHLRRMHQLDELLIEKLNHPKVTETGLARLRENLPSCKILDEWTMIGLYPLND